MCHSCPQSEVPLLYCPAGLLLTWVWGVALGPHNLPTHRVLAKPASVPGSVHGPPKVWSTMLCYGAGHVGLQAEEPAGNDSLHEGAFLKTRSLWISPCRLTVYRVRVLQARLKETKLYSACPFFSCLYTLSILPWAIL